MSNERLKQLQSERSSLAEELSQQQTLRDNQDLRIARQLRQKDIDEACASESYTAYTGPTKAEILQKEENITDQAKLRIKEIEDKLEKLDFEIRDTQEKKSPLTSKSSSSFYADVTYLSKDGRTVKQAGIELTQAEMQNSGEIFYPNVK